MPEERETDSKKSPPSSRKESLSFHAALRTIAPLLAFQGAKGQWRSEGKEEESSVANWHISWPPQKYMYFKVWHFQEDLLYLSYRRNSKPCTRRSWQMPLADIFGNTGQEGGGGGKGAFFPSFTAPKLCSFHDVTLFF